MDLLTEYSNRSDMLADLCAARNKIESLSARADGKRLSVRSKSVPCGTDAPTATSGYKPTRRLNASELDELVRAYQAGAKVADLAKSFGIHRETVGKHLRGRGIDTRDVGFSPEQIQEAAELYRQGWSLARLGGRFGVDDGTVRSRLLEVGVSMRPRRGGRRVQSK